MSCLRDGRHITQAGDGGEGSGRDHGPGTQFHHQTAAVVKKTNCMLAVIKNSFAVLNIFTLPLLFKALVRPLLEYGNVIRGPHYKLDQQALVRVQRRATKLLPQLNDLDYVHRLKALKLPSLQYRRQRGDMLETFKILTGRVRLYRDGHA